MAITKDIKDVQKKLDRALDLITVLSKKSEPKVAPSKDPQKDFDEALAILVVNIQEDFDKALDVIVVDVQEKFDKVLDIVTLVSKKPDPKPTSVKGIYYALGIIGVVCVVTLTLAIGGT